MIDIKEYLKQTKTVLLTQDAFDELKQRASAQPEVIHCRECRHHHYESKDIPYCDRIDYGYGWKDNDFCSRAKRRTDG